MLIKFGVLDLNIYNIPVPVPLELHENCGPIYPSPFIAYNYIYVIIKYNLNSTYYKISTAIPTCFDFIESFKGLHIYQNSEIKTYISVCRTCEYLKVIQWVRNLSDCL